jgi:glutamate dehydrogenase
MAALRVAEERKGEIIGGILEQISGRLPPDDAAAAERFARLFYRDVAPADLVERDPLDLYGAALALFRFGQERKAGAPKLRAYNPRLEQHGWQSVHTIVEIVNDDMPFLVDSVGMELARQGLGVHLVIHPVAGVRRDERGRLLEVGPAGGEDGDGAGLPRESFMHVEVDRQSDPAVLAGLERDLLRVLGDVRAAVADWRAMRERVGDAVAELRAGGARLPEAELAEAEAFLRWLADDHFTFLGYSAYELATDEAGEIQLRRIKGSGLGILRGHDEGGFSRSFAALPAAVRARAREPEPPLAVAKANARSTVHRSAYLDFVGVKRFSPQGEVAGEHRFLGLFTSAAYNLSPRHIPLLRRKVEDVVDRSGFPRDGHAGKALANILETYPRDELFQTQNDELRAIATEILHFQDRQKLRLFLRHDPYGRFVSCLVYVPRDRYNTALRERMQRVLEEALGGSESEFQALLGESTLARILFTVRTPDGVPADLDPEAVERRLVEISQGWSDRLRAALLELAGEEAGNRLFAAFGRSMSAGYQEEAEPRVAAADIQELDRLSRGPEGAVSLSLYRRLEDPADLLRLKLLRRDRPVLLSDALPIIENMGLKVLGEGSHEFRARDGGLFFLHDFETRPAQPGAEPVDVDAVRESFARTFQAVLADEAESDGFNRLVLLARLGAREIAVLRAYCKYLLQIGTPFSQAYIEQTLASNAGLARSLAELFLARFDPAQGEGREARVAALEAEIEAGLERVQSLDEDRILRRYLGLLRATLRTNHFQQGAGGRPKPYLSLKFASREVPGLPRPHPLYEIFVYSPSFEAIHLRGGRVARGGLRWSDRREDFRTEVLGLMKAQMVKNSVIVPVGAKGGFVLKRPPAGGDRAKLLEEGVRCYKLFLSGLLDITDNLSPSGIVPPADVVRRDGDDPYLVVAADKGTATFSDHANEVSLAYGFWLGDAFASGGSAGYDHKGMGITAKGAWESVRRHFRELGLDPQADPFTVTGVGDMSGDVFGNGMLLSDKIRLVAAFDHRHVFLDPDPDPATSFEERRRLFALPRSSWADYDPARISKGGGVYPRAAKRVDLSPEARAALGVEAASLTPAELMSAILKAPVDLFWNGGIGTFVKARAESHADAQDRGNDAIRVDAEDLRCRVVAEGGNLGLTQAARIAYALGGGRINTDFIDNSAGVDCSDHEVNIKILLQDAVANGDMTVKQRDQLLAEMTDEVGELVLRDNVLQNLALSMTEAAGPLHADAQIRLMRRLEAAGRLDRGLEGLPSDEALAERRRAGRGLTRPESAVLLAYAKMTLYEDLLATELPDRAYLADEVRKYFPRQLRRRFGQEIARHRLRRELVATWVANSVVNRGLDVFVAELQDETGADLTEAALAFVIARDAFALVPLWNAVEQLPAAVPAATQTRLLLAGRELLARGTRWFLAHGKRPLRIGEEVARFRPRIEWVVGSLDRLLAPSQLEALRRDCDAYAREGVPEDLARAVAGLPQLLAACDIVAVAETGGAAGGEERLLRVARVHFALAALLDLAWLGEAIDRAPRRSGWDRLALTQLADELAGVLRGLTRAAVEAGADGPDGEATAAAVEAWARGGALRGLDRYRALLAELRAVPEPDLAMLSVAVRTLSELLRGR